MPSPYAGNSRGLVLVEVTWILWSCAAIFLALRLYVRIRARSFWWDDTVVLLSFVG